MCLNPRTALLKRDEKVARLERDVEGALLKQDVRIGLGMGLQSCPSCVVVVLFL